MTDEERQEVLDTLTRRIFEEIAGLKAELKEKDGCPTVAVWEALVQQEAELRAERDALAAGLESLHVAYDGERRPISTVNTNDIPPTDAEYWKRVAHNRKVCCDVLNRGLRRVQRENEKLRAQLPPKRAEMDTWVPPGDRKPQP